MDIDMKLKDMSDRELILFNIGETRSVKNLLNNHLAHHEKQDDRRWKMHLALLLAAITFSGSIIVTFLTLFL